MPNIVIPAPPSRDPFTAKSLFVSAGAVPGGGAHLIEGRDDSVGTSQVVGLSLNNQAAATVGNQKYSLMVELGGMGWQTAAGGASAATKIGMQMRPVQGNVSAVGGVLLMQSNGNNGTAGAYQKFGSLYSVYDSSQATGGVTLAGWRLAIGAEAPGPSITLKNNEIYMGLSTSGNDTDTTWAYMISNAFNVFSDGAMYLGTPGHRWGGAHAQYYDTDQGVQLAAAATITPTRGQHHVTGATTIDTIAVGNFAGSSNPALTLVADSATITWSAAGNIALAGTLNQYESQRFVYDYVAAKWYPQGKGGTTATTAVYFHTADWAKSAGQTGVAGVAHTNAVGFKMSKPGTVTGARWWHPAGMTANVTVKLWNDSGTQLAAVTITPTANAINTASFAAAYSMTPTNAMYFISVYDGTNKILFNASIGKPGGYTSSSTVGGLWGPELWQYGHFWAPGDAAPLSAEDRVIGIEPLYTIT